MVVKAVFCHFTESEQWSFLMPYSSNKQGFLALSQILAWASIHSLPQELSVIPPRMGQRAMYLGSTDNILTVSDVEVEHSKVDIRGLEVLGEVVALGVTVRVGAIRSDS